MNRQPTSPMLRLAPRVAALALAALCAGCLERYMVIESKPAGAQVMIDGKLVGTTPITKLPYEHTGKRRFIVEKQGYERHISIQPVTGPWYFHFPLDFFTEVLIPYTFTVEHRLVFTLDEKKPETKEEVRARAEAFRVVGRKLPPTKRADFTVGEASVIVLEASAIVAVIVLAIAF